MSKITMDEQRSTKKTAKLTAILNPASAKPLSHGVRGSSRARNILGDPGAVSGDGEKKLFSSFLTFLHPNFFFARFDFSPSPLTAPGSPRMGAEWPVVIGLWQEPCRWGIYLPTPPGLHPILLETLIELHRVAIAFGDVFFGTNSILGTI